MDLSHCAVPQAAESLRCKFILIETLTWTPHWPLAAGKEAFRNRSHLNISFQFPVSSRRVGVFFKYIVCYLFSIELQSEMQTHSIVFLTEHLLIFQLFSLSEKSTIRSEGKRPARTLLQFALTGQNFGTSSLTMLGWKIR